MFLNCCHDVCVYIRSGSYSKKRKKNIFWTIKTSSHTHKKCPFTLLTFFIWEDSPHISFSHTHTQKLLARVHEWVCASFIYFVVAFNSFYSKSITLTHNFSLTSLSILYTISSLTLKINLLYIGWKIGKISHSFCLRVRAKKEVFFRWPGPLGMKIENGLKRNKVKLKRGFFKRF